MFRSFSSFTPTTFAGRLQIASSSVMLNGFTAYAQLKDGPRIELAKIPETSELKHEVNLRSLDDRLVAFSE